MIDKARTGGGWVFVPYAKLMIDLGNGLQELPENMRDLIECYDIQTEESGATTLFFSVQDPNFVLLNSSILTEDRTVYFEWGWANDWNNIARYCDMHIALVEPNFGKEGYPTLDITCMDSTHKMNREEKTRTFQNMKRSSIAKHIFQEYGMECYVEDSGELPVDVEEEIQQSNETDISFLQTLADEVVGTKFICYVENNKGYFCRRNYSQDPIIDMHYRDEVANDLKSFKCKINKEKVKYYKTSADINAETGVPFAGTCYSPTSNTRTQADTVIVGNEREKTPEEIEQEQNASKNTSAEKTAEDKFDNIQYEVCEGTVTPVVPIPTFPSRKCMNILGVGAALSGKYYIKSTQVTIDSTGITQSFEVRKSEFFGSLRNTDDSRDGRPSALVR